VVFYSAVLLTDWSEGDALRVGCLNAVFTEGFLDARIDVVCCFPVIVVVDVWPYCYCDAVAFVGCDADVRGRVMVDYIGIL